MKHILSAVSLLSEVDSNIDNIDSHIDYIDVDHISSFLLDNAKETYKIEYAYQGTLFKLVQASIEGKLIASLEKVKG